MLKKLHVYAGPEHEQTAQKPEVLEIVGELTERGGNHRGKHKVLWNRKKKKQYC